MTGYFGQAEYPLEQYGAAVPLGKMRPQVRRPSRVNFGAMALCLFVPWVLFCAMYSTMSFSLHYKDKFLCYLFVCAGLAFVVIMVLTAWDSVKKQEYDPRSDPTWSLFLAATCFLAWVCGVAAGDINYYQHMEPFYDTSNLNSYPSVDPSRMPGQQVMDAGLMSFTPGSKLDLKKTMVFHDLQTYCVAPIINGNNQTVYDFWAVGINCCAGIPGDFSCGEFNNPNAKSGLRAMREDQRKYYRLAVKQAESAFGIKAKHPLFFQWMQDPALELSAYADEGFKYFLIGVYAFLAVLLLLVIAAAAVGFTRA